MKFTYMSDLHLEFEGLELPEPTEPTVLLLAGDVGVGKLKSTYNYFLAEAVEKFDKVVYIPGNHEFYKGHIDKTWPSMKAVMADYLKDQGFDAYLKMINRETVQVGDVTIYGATLWTSLGAGDPYARPAILAGMYMSDYKVIRKSENYAKLTPKDTIAINFRDHWWLFDELKKTEGKKIVITHHAPSFESVNPKYVGDPLNPAYANNLHEEIEDLGAKAPDVWIHGHMHDSVNYKIGKTQVLANPRGYVGYSERPENPHFDPTKSFEL